MFVLFTGCGSSPKPSEVTTNPNAPATNAAAMPTPLKIERVVPGSTIVKIPFNVQPDGQAALAVFGTDIPGGSTVYWNDQALATTGAGTFIAAKVPAKLLEAPTMAAITVHPPNNGAPSNSMEFTVFGTTGPTPIFKDLYPGTTTPGKAFNPQPGGDSAFGIAGEGFLPGVSVMMDGKKLTTVFGSGKSLSAVVPASTIAAAGTHQVWTVNPDGKASNKVEFKVAK